MIKNIPAQLNEAGKIKIGKKGAMITSSGGKEFRPPEKLDHFQLVTTEKNEEGDYVVDVALENRIKEAGTGLVNEAGNLIGIPIRLLYNDTDLNFPTRLASYVSGKLSCTGDGETATKRIDDFTKTHPCPCPRFEQGYDGKDKCKPMGTLNCIIDEAGLFGQAHKFRTTSMNSVKGILGGIELIRTATNGRIAGLPLMLTMNAKSTQTPQGHNTIVYVVSVCYRGSMSDLRNEVLQLMSEEHQYMIGMDKLEAEARKALPQKTVTTDAEDLEVVEEFYPDALPVHGASAQVEYEAVQKSVEPEPQETEFETATAYAAPKNGETEPISSLEPADQDPAEEDTDLPGAPPVGPYKAVYEKLLAEKEYEKAVALVKRLTKNNLIYFLTQEYPNIQIEDGIKKPDLIELCETALAALVGEVGTTEEPFDVKKHPEYLAISNIPVDERVKFLNAVAEFFKPTPINRTTTRDVLLARVAVVLEDRIKNPPAVIKKEAQGIEQPTGQDPTPAPAPETSEPEPKPPAGGMAWDDSGLIEKPQLIQIVKLKKDMEMLGSLDVTKPEEWQEKYISCFLDANGEPHTSAVKLSKTQGDSLIEMLKAQDKIPF